MKNILVLSHCILNNASKVEMDESELALEYEVRQELMELVLNKNIQLMQLPCPEFILYGSQRWGHVKDQFNHPFYKGECERMLAPILLQLEEYAAHPDTFNILGIVSVEGSPSCGYRLTCTGEWKGELGTDSEYISSVVNRLRMSEEPGVYMEIIEKAIREAELDIPILTMNEAINTLEKL